LRPQILQQGPGLSLALELRHDLGAGCGHDEISGVEHVGYLARG
jgi:hypothetical protein